MHRVVKPFFDLKNDNHRYEIGDEYPAKGCIASDARIAELSGNKNRLGTPLIVEVKAQPEKVEEVKAPTKKRKKTEG